MMLLPVGMVVFNYPIINRGSVNQNTYPQAESP
jgi:hypothetical protein